MSELTIRTVGGPGTVGEALLLHLHVALHTSGGDPTHILDLLASFLRKDLWHEIVDLAPGEREEPAFLRFVEGAHPHGLGTSREQLLKIIMLQHRCETERGRDPETFAEVQAVRARVRDLLNPELETHGSNQHGGVDNINSCPAGGGTSEAYTIRRLKRDRPELAEKVIRGEVSAHRAAQEAGFRKKQFSVPADPERAAHALMRHFSAHELTRLLEVLHAASGLA